MIAAIHEVVSAFLHFYLSQTSEHLFTAGTHAKKGADSLAPGVNDRCTSLQNAVTDEDSETCVE